MAHQQLKQRYQYQPLPGRADKHIRIATIHPGRSSRFNHDVQVTLRIEPFEVSGYKPSPGDQIPSYEAVSYCWGTEENAGRILIRDNAAEDVPHEWDQWLPARANLLSALRHMRYTDRPRDMWIDAICVSTRCSHILFGCSHIRTWSCVW